MRLFETVDNKVEIPCTDSNNMIIWVQQIYRASQRMSWQNRANMPGRDEISAVRRHIVNKNA